MPDVPKKLELRYLGCYAIMEFKNGFLKSTEVMIVYNP
jgi:hypothetical protein